MELTVIRSPTETSFAVGKCDDGKGHLFAIVNCAVSHWSMCGAPHRVVANVSDDDEACASCWAAAESALRGGDTKIGSG